MNHEPDEGGEKNEVDECIQPEGDMHLGHWTFECTGAFYGGHLRIASTNVETLGGRGEFRSCISCKHFI